MQMAVLLKRKSAIIMYFIFLLLVLKNYFGNIIKCYGKDSIIEMYHPMKLISLAEFSSVGFYFMQYFPLLVVIPAAFSFISDRNTSSFVFMQSRVGKKTIILANLLLYL